jgi:microsomal epoxide hydrolase
MRRAYRLMLGGEVSTGVNALSPAPIAVEERVLEDLRSRLRATFWPEDNGP